MVYVIQMGEIYMLEDADWRKLCQDGKDGRFRTWKDYKATKVANDSHNITDWVSWDYEDELQELEADELSE